MSGFELGVVGVFFFLVLLRVVIGLVFAQMLIRPVRRCPACFQATLPIHPRWWALIPRRYEWRWCPRCGWQGPGRRVEAAPPSGPERPLEASVCAS